MHEERSRRKKKPNKQQRDARRAHDADIFNEGFKMGYLQGLRQGTQDGQAQALQYAERERQRWAHYGK